MPDTFSNSFNPFDAERLPCWYCSHYAGACWGDSSLADCRRDPARPRCAAQAERGCASWSREPGVDDDLWQPPPRAWAAMKEPGTRPG